MVHDNDTPQSDIDSDGGDPEDLTGLEIDPDELPEGEEVDPDALDIADDDADDVVAVDIAIDGDENTCANNVCSLDAPPATPAPAIAVSGANNVVLGNVCRTVPPVTNTGGPTNEVAHNI